MRSLVILLVVGLSSAGLANAADRGTYFSHGDWEVACDNTGTCRAAGYGPDDGNSDPVSVLLTRAAGAGTAVAGELAIGTYDDEPFPGDSAPTLTMWVAGRDVGPVVLHDLTATLAPAQVQALLATVTGDDNIAWIAADGRRWALSTRGANAVLLKLDDVQGRVGTPGALVRRGGRSESTVPAPRPAPIVRAPTLVPTRPGDAAMVNDSEGLGAALIATLTETDECFDYADPEGEHAPLDVVRLDDDSLLVSTRCWLAAYNAGSGYWVVDDAPPWNPVLVTTMGTDFADGTITAAHKGRGIGDCWSSDAWTWDGRAFVHTAEATTGLCRLVVLGGTWSLPTLVTEVVPSP